ncbi:MAG: RNA polymerase subunit sigma-70 [Terriglobia bacterium]|nr:MAG: RNA polymerase subunit sigma-70 [Terriglobia bacterium]
MVPDAPITQLLRESREGRAEAMDQLMALAYRQLHALASQFMRAERPNHTLSTTALVHETYLKLIGADIPWEDRGHFFSIAARSMRRILVDHAKSRNRHKRKGKAQKVSLDDIDLADPRNAVTILEIDDGLERLANQDARMAQILELLYFGGLTYEEVAQSLNISAATVHRELRMGKAWLQSALAKSPQP